jgi:dihydroxycyclohexadiene carboxylate dehydrogenase
MLKKKKGVIVNVSSIATRGVNRVPYAAAKGGVNALTAALAMEHTQNGIRINATAPGGTEAPVRKIPRNASKQSRQEKVWYQAIVDQTKASSLMHRYGSIEEQVEPILFFASDASSYITGTVLAVGGGDLG